MNVSELKGQMQGGGLPHFLVFSGPEWQVQKIYIQHTCDVLGAEYKYIDSVSEILSSLNKRSFIQKRYCYVVRDDKLLMTDESLQDKIESLLKDNTLILLVSSVDKRTKFYKRYHSEIVEFDALSDVLLRKYIKREIDLSDENCDKLIGICEHDYGRILLEIDKIKQFDSWNTVDADFNDCFQVLLSEGVIHQSAYDAIFDFVDAILDWKIELSFDLLEQCYAVGEATMVMLSVLYNNAKAVLQVQTCNSRDVAKATGLTGWQIKNAKKHLEVRSEEELIELLRIVQKVERGIKTGKMEECYAMEYVLVNILR